MVSPADVRALGYEVTPAGDGYRVVGFGVASYFAAADLAKFADSAAHAERVKQYEEGPPERPPPTEPVEQKVAAELAKLDPDKATVGDLLAAVQAVLTDGGVA